MNLADLMEASNIEDRRDEPMTLARLLGIATRVSPQAWKEIVADPFEKRGRWPTLQQMVDWQNTMPPGAGEGISSVLGYNQIK